MKKSKIDLVTISSLLLGFILGYICVDFYEFESYFASSLVGFVISTLLEVVMILLAFYLQIIVHELGHLFFGLLSGYQFVSFRIGSLMLIKTNGKFKFKKFTLAGTAGQCLLTIDNDNYPFVLYMLGGVINNVIISTLCLLLYFLIDNPFLNTFGIICSICGYYLALTNGIPSVINTISNDGQNVIDCLKDENARNALLVQLKMVKHQSDGLRSRDIDDELLALKSDANVSNSLINYVAVLKENKLFDQHDFDSAYELINQILNGEKVPRDINATIIKLDKLVIDLIKQKEQCDISIMNDKTIKKFMKTMLRYPSVILTNYAYNKLYLKDALAALKVRKIYEKLKRSYPYAGQMISLGEMMDYIDLQENM